MKFLSNVLLIVLICLLAACSKPKPKSQLVEIKQRGTLRVLSVVRPTIYYVKSGKPQGFEYELLKMFADRLGVRLQIQFPSNLNNMMAMIQADKADIASANLAVTSERKKNVRFGPIYNEVTQQLVYKMGQKKPLGIQDIINSRLVVLQGSSYAEQLRALKIQFPELTWKISNKNNILTLLEAVKTGKIDYTVVDSNILSVLHNLYPSVKVAFDISDPQSVAWAMPKPKLKGDNSLSNAVKSFFDDLESSGKLDKLTEKYYGQIRRFNYIDSRSFNRRITTHLPKYQHFFEQAAAKYNFDWRLLAAMSYQESHWNPDAISYTGVEGLMMLTQATAKEMNITNRTDPKQSIMAGAKYLRSIYSRLPDSVQMPDRLWFAMAAYNIGLGHLEDARVITQSRGKNPNLWADVKKSLPLLSQRKWFSKTRYGYARGGEPVKYVANIRGFEQVLQYHKDTAPDVDDQSDDFS